MHIAVVEILGLHLSAYFLVYRTCPLDFLCKKRPGGEPALVFLEENFYYLLMCKEPLLGAVVLLITIYCNSRL